MMHAWMQRMIGLFGVSPPFKGDVFLETSAGCICFYADASKVDFVFFLVIVNVDWTVGWWEDLTSRHSVFDDEMNTQ